MNLTREEVAETVEATIEIDAQVTVETGMATEEEMTVAPEITEATEMTVVVEITEVAGTTVAAEITEAKETTEVEEITEETGIEAVEAEVQIVTEAEALMIEEAILIDPEIATLVTVEAETDTAQEALIEEEADKAGVDLDKTAEEVITVENLVALDKAGIEVLTEVVNLQNHHGRRINQHSRKSLPSHSGRLGVRKVVTHIILVLKKSNQRSTKRGNEHGC